MFVTYIPAASESPQGWFISLFQSSHHMKAALSVLLLLAMIGAASALTLVTECADLTTPGETYVLDSDVSGDSGGGICIHVVADGITLQCNKNGIQSKTPASERYGIYVEGNDATIQGCYVSGFTYGDGDLADGYGIYVDEASGVRLESDTLESNDHGIYLYRSDDAVLEDCSASGNTLGIYLYESDRAELSGNLVETSMWDAYTFYASDDALIEGNLALENSGMGFYFWAYDTVSGALLRENEATMNGGAGFDFVNSVEGLLERNNASWNGVDGFSFRFSGDAGSACRDFTLRDNLAWDNGHPIHCLPGTFPCPRNGILVDECESFTLEDNEAWSNQGSGIFVYASSYCSLDRNIAHGNGENGFHVSSHVDTRRSLNNLTENQAFLNAMDGYFLQDDRNILLRNNATENGMNGFHLDRPYCPTSDCSGNDNILIGNLAEGNGYGPDEYCYESPFQCNSGFLIQNVNGTEAEDNRALGNEGFGFRVMDCGASQIHNNLADGNGEGGFDIVAVEGTGLNNQLSGNIARRGFAGLRFTQGASAALPPRATLTDNAISGNDYGLLVQSGRVDMRGGALYGNLVNDVLAECIVPNGTSSLDLSMVRFDRDGGDMTDFIVVSVEDELGFDPVLGGEGYTLDHAAEPLAGLPGTGSFRNKFLEVSDLCPDPMVCLGAQIDSITMHWTLVEGKGYTFPQLWKYNVSGWHLIPSMQSGRSLSILGMDSFSTLSLLANETNETSSGGDGDDDPAPPDLRLQASYDCEDGLLVDVDEAGQMVEGAFVRVFDGGSIISSAYTDASGRAVLQGIPCGAPLIISAGESGREGEIQFDYPCSQCAQGCPQGTVLDPQSGQCVSPGQECPQGQEYDEQSGSCVESIPPEQGCSSDAGCVSGQRCEGGLCVDAGCQDDSDCDDDQYCDEGSGICRDVEGCGLISGHALIEEWECGEQGCPECGAEEVCQDHLCMPVPYDLSGPSAGYVGDRIKLVAYKGSEPCSLCDISFIGPSGESGEGKTEADGSFLFRLSEEGTYEFRLLRAGVAAKIRTVSATMPETALGQETPGEDLCGLPLALLLIALLSAAAYLLYKRMKETKKG